MFPVLRSGSYLFIYPVSTSCYYGCLCYYLPVICYLTCLLILIDVLPVLRIHYHLLGLLWQSWICMSRSQDWVAWSLGLKMDSGRAFGVFRRAGAEAVGVFRSDHLGSTREIYWSYSWDPFSCYCNLYSCTRDVIWCNIKSLSAITLYLYKCQLESTLFRFRTLILALYTCLLLSVHTR